MSAVCKTAAYVLSGSTPQWGTKTVKGTSAPIFTRLKSTKYLQSVQ
jgi:hypothetical protein